MSEYHFFIEYGDTLSEPNSTDYLHVDELKRCVLLVETDSLEEATERVMELIDEFRREYNSVHYYLLPKTDPLIPRIMESHSNDITHYELDSLDKVQEVDGAVSRAAEHHKP